MKEIPRVAGFPFAAVLALAVLSHFPATVHAGDSLYGTVTGIKRADLITLDYGAGTYDIRLAGIDLPKDAVVAREADRFVADMLLGKPARLRFDGRKADGEMVGRLHTDDPKIGMRDVGVELVRSGLAVPEPGYRGYKYAELTRAQAEARANKAGIWRDR